MISLVLRFNSLCRSSFSLYSSTKFLSLEDINQTMIQFSQQSCLVIQKSSNSSAYFQVQKEGIEFFRNLSNKQTRIVFNVTMDTEITSFNKTLLNAGCRSSTIALPKDSCLSSLTVCKNTQQLPDGEILVVLNARSHNGQPSPYLMAVGYLVASLIVIHEQGPFNPQNIEISRHLQQFSGIRGLESERHPHLLYLLHDIKDKINGDVFNSLKKRQLQRLEQYFPARTASNLYQPDINKIVQKLKSRLHNCILNNKPMTLTKIQMLLTEMCSRFNSIKNRGEMEILSIQMTVQSSYKNKIMTQTIDLYRKLLSRELPSDSMPYCQQQLWSSRRHIELLVEQHLKQIGQLQILCQLHQEEQSIWSQLTSDNNKAKQQLAQCLYSELAANNWCNSPIQMMIYEATYKLETFVSKTISKQSLSRLVVQTVSKIQESCLEKLSHLESLEEENYQIKQQLEQLRQNYERLQMRYEMERDQSVLLRQTILEKSDREENVEQLVEDVMKLKLKLKNCKEITDGQQIQIDNLYELIDSYKCVLGQGSKSKSYIPNLIYQFNNSVAKFVKVFEKMQHQLPSLLKQLNRKREQVYKQTIKDSKEISELNANLNKIYKQMDVLKTALKVSQETALIYREIIKMSPEHVQAKMQEETKKQVQLAQLQSKVFVYQKYLDLVKMCRNDRRMEPLEKFVRTISDKKIKARLQAVPI